jgi:hypothetical protein
MHTGTAPDQTAPRVLQPSSLPETIEPDITRCALLAMSSGRTAEHDASLLVAALEDIEARRAAIEWLLNANLLCLCLV